MLTGCAKAYSSSGSVV